MAVEQQAGETPAGLFRGPAAYAARTPWGPFSGTLAAIIIVTLGIIAGLLLVFWGGIARVPPASDDRWDSSTLVVLGVWQVTVIILVLLAGARPGGTITGALSLGPPSGGPSAYVIAPLLMLVVQIVVGIVQYHLTDRDMYVDLRPFVGFAQGPQWPLALAIIGIGAPLSEELLIRGFLLSALARSRLQVLCDIFFATTFLFLAIAYAKPTRVIDPTIVPTVAKIVGSIATGLLVSRLVQSLFRGVTLSAQARSRLGFAGAALLTTIIWAGLHAGYSAVGLAEVFVIGMFFCWLLWRTGSLRVTIFCHALYNSLVLLTLRFVALPAA